MQPRLHDCADCGRHPEPANELPRQHACRQLRCMGAIIVFFIMRPGHRAAARRTIVDKFVDNLAALVESRRVQRTQVKLNVMRGKQVKLNTPQRTHVETNFRLELTGARLQRTGAPTCNSI